MSWEIEHIFLTEIVGGNIVASVTQRWGAILYIPNFVRTEPSAQQGYPVCVR